jgi:hypothetical protein
MAERVLKGDKGGRPFSRVPNDLLEEVREMYDDGKTPADIRKALQARGTSVSLPAIKEAVGEVTQTLEGAAQTEIPGCAVSFESRVDADVFREIPLDVRTIAEDMIRGGSSPSAIVQVLGRYRVPVSLKSVEAYRDERIANKDTEANLSTTYATELRNICAFMADMRAKAADIYREMPEYERNSAKTYLKMKELELDGAKAMTQLLKVVNQDNSEDVQSAIQEIRNKLKIGGES